MTQAPEIEKTSRRGRTPAPEPAVTGKKAKAAPVKPTPRAAGGPRVDLLPPIVETRRKQNARIRLLMLGLVGIALIAVAASLAVALLAGAAEGTLKSAQQRSVQLLQEQSSYAEVSQVKSQLLDYDSARVAALYSEADWARLMRELDAALPADVAITAESITIRGLGSDKATSSPDGAVTIDAPGVIEISFSATAPTFVSPTPILNGLKTMTGYLSANVSAVSNTGEGFDITGVVQLDASALGGTARTGTLDPDTLKELHDSLFTVAVTPPASSTDGGATTDGTGTGDGTGTDGAAEGTTGTGE
ncbi:hypothetical protein [Microbacterium sp.]|uniref:hypothetical protein n=1 Tax=Microbacterium sp. TaxID=51671 RepID=UPI00289B12C1|nr:hypothetical protein [Microbacterium sp.]